MSSRSLNKVSLIGNMTRDPELRYTPAGTAVCTFGLATNRSWVTQTGETKEDTEFHRIVAWNKLGEVCSQLLSKGRKIFVEGRLSTHSWTGQDGTQRTTTEIVIEDMIILDSRKTGVSSGDSSAYPTHASIHNAKPVESMKDENTSVSVDKISEPVQSAEAKKKNKKDQSEETKEDNENIKESKNTQKNEKSKVSEEDITPDDIPF